MPARRSDYVLLNQRHEIPHHFWDCFPERNEFYGKTPSRLLEEIPKNDFAGHPLASTGRSSGAAPLFPLEKNPYAPRGKIPLSCLDRNRHAGLERVCESIESYHLPPDGNPCAFPHLGCRTFAQRNSYIDADWFGACKVAEAGFSLPAAPNPPFAAGEQLISQSLDQCFFKAGLWPALDLSSAGDGNIGGCGLPVSSFLQRQSSGSSFTDSLFSSDVPLSTLSPTLSLSASDSTLFSLLREDGCKREGNKGSRQDDGSAQSWAQHTEQTYNLQLALALRVMAAAELTEEPFLSSNRKDFGIDSYSASQSSVEATALRFWVNGSLGYGHKIQDGFYHIFGMNPYVWKVCTDADEGGHMPSLDCLKEVDAVNSSVEVILIDKYEDTCLQRLEDQALNLASKAAGVKDLAEQLGRLVCELMGGAMDLEHGELMSRWEKSSGMLKGMLNSVVLPIGHLSVGLCRHRALLFKALADRVDLPCRIIRGCKYCGLDIGASCLVLCAIEREFLVDLIADPGALCSPESFLRSLPSPQIASPLRLPELKSSEPAWKVHVVGAQGRGKSNQGLDTKLPQKQSGRSFWGNAVNDSLHINFVPFHGKNDGNILSQDLALQKQKQRGLVVSSNVLQKELDSVQERGLEAAEDMGGALANLKNLELSLASDGLEIPWEDLTLKERIGAGSFGTVHRADWHGSDVAVKILVGQDFCEERLQEFMREVEMMKRVRHRNVVLFMGAVTKPPNFAIVTEYLPRGSLFRLLHRAGARDMLDEKRQIRIALDVAKGMNYLHQRSPPIVHRDLKSPNLLVDSTWVVKVCDFGLSRFKANKFLSQSAAGTHEWMAPEVLRDEPSNEKCDVYSFGVILWELVTLQRPWSGLSHAEVVGAVGFQNRRLQIPKDVNPKIAAIIELCWASDPRQRPSFASIMESLKSLQKSTMNLHTGCESTVL
eukprot:c28991_g1_i1 orf=309-3122(-)